MGKKIAIAVALVAVGVLGYAATQPDEFRVQREKYDPKMKRTHSGAACGKGAVYAWEGNSQAGAGRMEILEA